MSSATASHLNLQIPDGQDRDTVVAKLVELKRWDVVLDGRGIQRDFRFKGFNKCWAFMNSVAEECKKAKHHPEWSNTYNRTTVTWTTHNPEGLTIKDVEMAEFCDERAKEYGEVGEEVEVRGCDGKTQGKT